ncbi:MAG: hypothetical protein NZ934_05100 [Hadesarchaea archaeon]|nr:hypothetical protein [Hadesarchaea archaeon]
MENRERKISIKGERFSRKSRERREYLNDPLTNDLTRDFYAYPEGKVKVSRISITIPIS